MQSTWTTLEPRVPGVPFTKKDIEDAADRPAEEPLMTRGEARSTLRKIARIVGRGR